MIFSEQWGKWKGSKTKKDEEIKSIMFWQSFKVLVRELRKPSNIRFAYSLVVLSNLLDERLYGRLRRMIVNEKKGKWKGSKVKKAEEIVAIICYARFWSDVKMIMTLCRQF